eukprot:TRINITY_DN2027_c0_g1_i6.p1 TRINITY_DN2027_c0_g1~~TRINITY_DN2027_c0_g1_i6.p1  ORF type:complete len:116 (+),score=11.01 TRINITY_DN2027_c0_g1_i6:152-499(+)
MKQQNKKMRLSNKIQKQKQNQKTIYEGKNNGTTPKELNKSLTISQLTRAFVTDYLNLFSFIRKLLVYTATTNAHVLCLSLIHISEPTRRTPISYAVFCLKKKNWSSRWVVLRLFS